MAGRGTSVSLTLTLTALVFAGCIAGDETDGAPEVEVADLSALSAKLFDDLEVFNVKVPGHDGKMQDNWVYKPKADDSNQTFPVFINFSPYWRNLAGNPETKGDAFAEYMIAEYVPRGYAVVLASVRGTGHSEGCFPIGGIPELEDAYAVIDHFANVEWSNGNVASGGKSYDGTTIQGVAGYKPHPALKLIFPVSGISDLYRYNYRGGVPYFQGPIFNTYYYAGVGVNQNGDIQDQPLSALVDDVACADTPFVQGHGVATGVHGMYNDYWNERDYNNYAADVETAVYFVHGLQDWNVKPDHILPWLGTLQEVTDTKILLHQWTEGGTGHVYPMRDDWNETMLRIMDHYLKGIDTGLMSEPTVQVQDSAGMWRNEWEWPPARAVTTPLYLHEDGAASFEAPDPNGEQIVTDDPDTGLLTWEITLDDDLRYAGSPVFHADLMTTNPYGAFSAQLFLVEDGETTWMNEGVLRAYLRDSMETPSPVVPGMYESYAIEFYPQDDVFPAGSTLRLVLSQSQSRHALMPPTEGALTGIDYASEPYLELLRFDVAEDGFEAPQPIETPCFTC